MNKEQIVRLRTTPIGGTTRVNGITIKVEPTARFDHICQLCEFQTEGGAEACIASEASMANKRPDKTSVYFVKG